MAIFMSYSRSDEVAVKALVRGLEAARKEVWFDNALTGGEIWWDSILENIRSASVFLFALSDDSLKSKPCRTELEYATALSRPVVPVRVGNIANPRLTPFGAVQIISFRPDDALSAFALLAAVDEAGRRVTPLPDPLPAPPMIPFGYLMQLRQQIDDTQLDPRAQGSAVDQLRRALIEETDLSVHGDIIRMLVSLREKSWATRGTEHEINQLLRDYEAGDSSAGAPGTHPSNRPDAAGPEGGRGSHAAQEGPIAAEPVPAPDWYPDPAHRHRWRWFADDWTRYVSDGGGVVLEDPL